MNQSSDDSQIREAMQRLRRAQERHVPTFEDLLERPARVTDRRPAGRLRFAVACCTAALLLLTVFVTLSRWNEPPDDSGLRIVEDFSPGPVLDQPQDERAVDINFEQLHAVIDTQFARVEAPEWPTRTDSLLAVNLDVSSFRE